MKSEKTIKCVVACTNSVGSPDFFLCKIVCTDSQYNNGKHYAAAKAAAKENDYEGEMVAFDEFGGPNWLFTKFGWRDAIKVCIINPFEKDGYDLCCYSPGSGALSFVYLKDGKAGGPAVTLEEAQNWLKNSPDAENYRLKKWRVVNIGTPQLVANIHRVSEDTLSYEGRTVKYTIDDNILWQDKKLLNADFLHVYARDREYSRLFTSPNGYEVKNQSTKHAIAHFIENEAALQAQDSPA